MSDDAWREVLDSEGLSARTPDELRASIRRVKRGMYLAAFMGMRTDNQQAGPIHAAIEELGGQDRLDRDYAPPWDESL